MLKIKKLYIIIFTIFSILAYGQNQLDPFTFEVEVTPETCNGNGTMTITPNGLTEGTTVTYTIENNTDTNYGPITTQNTNINSLISGNYTITATQSSDDFGIESNQHIVDNVVVEDQTIPVEFGIVDVQHVACGNDGTFTLDVTSGTEPYSYQIIDPDNQNTIIINQQSPIFSGLTPGEYRVRVVDSCGIGSVETITIEDVIFEPISYEHKLTHGTQDCNLMFRTRIKYTGPSSLEGLEWTVSVNYNDPNSGELISSEEITRDLLNGSTTIATYLFDIESFPGQEIDYNVVITDPCGTITTETVTLLNPYQEREITEYNVLYDECGEPYGFDIVTDGVQKPLLSKISDTEITQAPDGVNIDDITIRSSTVSLTGIYTKLIGIEDNPLEPGLYKGNLTTCSGQNIPFEYDYQPTHNNETFQLPPIGSALNHTEVCGTNYHKFQFNFSTSEITNIQVLNPPNNGIFYWSKTGNYYNLYFSDYPGGTYNIEFTNRCDQTVTQSIEIGEIVPYVFSTISVEKVCGGFNLVHDQDSSEGNIEPRVLQYYNEELGNWTSPVSDNTGNVIDDLNSLSNNDWNRLESQGKAYELDASNEDAPNYSSDPNLISEGKFRIIKRKRYPVIGSDNTIRFESCYEIDEFSNFQMPIISKLYAYECDDNTYDVSVVSDLGTPPYRYQIVTAIDAEADNSSYIIRNNEDNPLFTGLSSGSYYFRVFDACGNYTTERYDITKLGTPQIVTTANCDSNSIQLAVNGVDYLNFEWYKEDAPNTILSTTHYLDLGEWDASKAGKYSVRLTSNGTGTCVNEVSTVELAIDPFNNPYAGVDFSTEISGGPINLLELVNNNNSSNNVSQTGSFEIVYQNGQDETNSGRLIENTWYSNEAAEGNYTIKYNVDGLCSGTDDALITIYNRYVCVKPPTPGSSAEHPPIGISTLNRGDDSNEWLTGYNNGWIALESRTGGMVITRANSPEHPENTIENPVEGMIVFDIDENCIKLYDGVKWDCVYRGCNEEDSTQP